MKNPEEQLPEIWGGIECTINRVDDSYLDQLDLAGLYHHPEFIDSVIDLGVKRLRFPILWEKHQPSPTVEIDWTFTEVCLEKLRSRNVEPVAGLLHHGSGPAFTDLLQEDFPELFASYAAAVATKFPWLQYYTPVNEPLTTARFSGLYGYWYPHKKNDVSFIKILLNELKASVLAMQQIRKVNPAAKFIQTEDLGKTYSTPLLSYQAQFENHRRWLTYDILCGSFNQEHPLWNYVMRLGIDHAQLEFFLENPCPPDIIGVNYYITSERFLDDHIEAYPVELTGGNSLHDYVDTEAIRIEMNEPHGLEYLLNEIWSRYKIPLAITEAHLNCTREDQLRWLKQVFDTAVKVKNEGIDMQAVTAWALLGSSGWNKLLTCQPCDYETGAFDISAGYLRPTALASLITKLVKREEPSNHLVSEAGWWKLGTRFYKKIRQDVNTMSASSQPLIIIGKTGTLGRALSKLCTQRNIYHLLLGRSEADICDEDRLSTLIDRHNPWAIINAAGYVKVDEAETDKDTCYKGNFLGCQNLSAVCGSKSVKLMTFSSDLVFDGKKGHPYVETDFCNPVNTYGHSKQLAEELILSQNPTALIIRSAAFFGPWDEYNFAHDLLINLQRGSEFYAPDDITVSPTYVPHLVNASLDLLIDDAAGTWHLTNRGCLSWYEFAKKIVNRTNFNPQLVIPACNLQTPAKRPPFSALKSIKYNLMPTLDEALDNYFLSLQLTTETLTFKTVTNERL